MTTTTATMKPGTLINCGKCDGTGRIRAFAHIVGGMCFACQGEGKVAVRKPLPSLPRPPARRDGLFVVFYFANPDGSHDDAREDGTRDDYTTECGPAWETFGDAAEHIGGLRRSNRGLDYRLMKTVDGIFVDVGTGERFPGFLA